MRLWSSGKAVRRASHTLQADPHPVLVLGPDGAPGLGDHVLEDGLLSTAAAAVLERALAAAARAASAATAARSASAARTPRAANDTRRPPRCHAPHRLLLFFREIIDDDAADAAAVEAPDAASALAAIFARVSEHRRRLHRSGCRCT